MVYCINTYRTWIEVADDNLYKEHIISRTDRTDYLVSRTLVLRAFKTNGIHAEGTTWTIPEHELDKALAIYRKQDSTFKQRIKKAAMYFSPKDAETLIRLATYGIVQLELIVRPTPIPESPITYVTEYPATHFCAIPFGVSMSLYKNNKRFMTPFTWQWHEAATPVNCMCKYG